MRTIFSFRPELFNNNGDQGSIEVLKLVLDEAKVSYADSDIAEADFVLVGDCSIAVLNHFRDELLSLAPALRRRLQEGRATLIVGRPYELLAPELGIELSEGDRESKFCLVKLDDGDYFGYHNSVVESPKVYRQGFFVGTTLFGPFLAKNPQFLDDLLKNLGIDAYGPKIIKSMDYAKKVRDATSFD
jgi:CobQ-like glutamine amidotransferase family enzyme